MTVPWVCLLYHDVVQDEPRVTGGPEYFSVSSSVFCCQLDLMRTLGFQGCSIERALRVAEPCVAISFDDGTAGMYERAFPALRERGMTATFFVTTRWVGTPGYVTWDQLREMRAGGMSIQSHTRTHPFLSEMPEHRLWDELRGSKEDLDAALGQCTDQIGLPGGDAPRGRLYTLLSTAGYTVIGTSRWGVNHGTSRGSPHRIRRCTVRGAPSPDRFRRIVVGDLWLGLRRRAREATLGTLRRQMGPSRYARWRRRLLDAVGRNAAARESAPGAGP